jgi:hypothetical protein
VQHAPDLDYDLGHLDGPTQQVDSAAAQPDPDGQRWPRGKRHDDASAAFCQLT